MPKVPDAIYSPARSTVSTQTSSQAPSSAPRGIFSRSNSAASFSTVAKPPSGDDYPSSAATPVPGQGSASGSGLAATRPQGRRLALPPGETVTVQELLAFMHAGSADFKILLVDVRSRDEFDDGHIMSQSTICIERDVLQRQNISASQISDSMVLAPPAEADAFERRWQFDLVIFYDQDSQGLKSQPATPQDTAVVGLYKALAHFDFATDKHGEHPPPRLLRGGIDAWAKVMGSASLQTSSTAGEKKREKAALRPAILRPSTAARPTAKYLVKPIQDADEAKRWEESLKDMDNSSFVRTTDDFLRRFPPVSAIQESMTSPVVAQDDLYGRSAGSVRAEAAPPPPPLPLMPSSSSTRADVQLSLPSPPTRPPPTVPRPATADLMMETDEGEDDHVLRAKKAKAKAAAPMGGGKTRRHAVGLVNPKNWCYANSSLQSLFGSGRFADELITGAWADSWKVPMKTDEKIRHPQLLVKIMANFFSWMQTGNFEVMKAKTLMEYCYSIHSRDFDGSIKADKSTIFGGAAQQDAQEYISFLITTLHDETNRMRNRTGEIKQPEVRDGDTTLSNALVYWAEYRKFNDSLIDRHWRGIEVACRRCRACGHLSNSYEPFDVLYLPIPGGNDRPTTMADLLADYCTRETIEGYKCDKCNHVDTTEKQARLVRMPDLLCIAFRRFRGNENDGFKKNNAMVTFPINGLDMTPYTAQARDAPSARPPPPYDDDDEFRAPFTYNCYAVIVHSGTLKAGHYRAFVREDGSPDPGAWNHLDDTVVEPVQIGTADPARDVSRRLFKDANGASAYMVFYQRRETA